MRQICFILFILNSLIAIAQEYNSTFLFNGKDYTVAIKQGTGGFVDVSIRLSGGTESENFSIKPFNIENFKTAFPTYLLILDGTSKDTIVASTSTLNNNLEKLFFEAVASFLAEPEPGPVAGQITINKNVEVMKMIKNDSNGKFTGEVLDVQIEFQDGYIESILVTIQGENKISYFNNQYGIGFSSRNNFARLNRMWLYNSKDEYRPSNNAEKIRVSDLLSYKYSVRNQSRDLSPGDGTYVLYPSITYDLRKEPNEKILEAIVFSDFVGLDQSKPNGLIQTEVSKRININTNRHEPKILARILPWKAFGTFQYIKPDLLLSKLEENNKNLILYQNNSIENGTILMKPYTTALDLVRYQNFSTGFDLNFLLLDNPHQKFIFTANGGLRFSRTSVRDSLFTLEDNNGQDVIVNSGRATEFGVNSFQWNIEEKIQFLPDERYGFIISLRQIYHNLIDTRIEQKSFDVDDPGSVANKTNKWLSSIELLAYLKASDKGKLFARYRLTYERKNMNQNFQQMQVGYSFYILSKSKK